MACRPTSRLHRSIRPTAGSIDDLSIFLRWHLFSDAFLAVVRARFRLRGFFIEVYLHLHKRFKMRTHLFIAVVAVVAAGPLHTHADQATPAKLMAATVFVQVQGRGADGKPAQWSGTGVAVTDDGWIITNRHVVPGDDQVANTIRVYFNPGTPSEYDVSASLYYVHPDRDLALLKCDGLSAKTDFLTISKRVDVFVTEPIQFAGYPLGRRISANESDTPSVTITTGAISGKRAFEDQSLWWIDCAAGAIGGNSGGPLVDEDGEVIGLIARGRADLSRAVPASYIQELLGEACLKVHATAKEGITENRFQVSVTGDGPGKQLKSGSVEIVGQSSRRVRLSPSDHGLDGIVRIDQEILNRSPVLLLVKATTTSGLDLQLVVRVDKSSSHADRMLLVIHQITLGQKKANGWPYDGDAPDPFAKIWVNGICQTQTETVQNQHRFSKRTALYCNSGNSIDVVVYDRDISHHDFAGNIALIASDGLEVTKPSKGEINSCLIRVRKVPYRYPVSKETSK